MAYRPAGAMQERSHILFSTEDELLLRDLQQLLLREREIRGQRSIIRRMGLSADDQQRRKLVSELERLTDELDETNLAMRGPFGEAKQSKNQSS